MGRWIGFILEDGLLPLISSLVLALLGGLSFFHGVLFFWGCTLVHHLIREHGIIAETANRILASLLAPIPTMALMMAIFRNDPGLNPVRFLAGYASFVGYSTILAFALPVVEAVSGAPERYED